MKNLYFAFLLVITLLTYGKTYSQLLPPNRPEQDACNALVICGNGFFSPYSYQGEGFALDMTSTPCNSGEGNSMWLKLIITGSGSLVFNITPQLNSDDYDFAIVNATGKNCGNLTGSDVVRCNFNKNVPITNNGVVGLNNSANLQFVPANTQGDNFLQQLNVLAGQTYLIMINNFGTGNNPSSGFTINFSGSTAVFNDQVPPRFTSITHSCFTASEAIIQLSEQIKCSSIAANGSDFLLNSGTIVSATGINCNSSNQGYTDKVRVVFSPALPAGVYTLKAKKGTDNNTLLDLCDNELRIPDSLMMNVYPDNSIAYTLDTIGCQSLMYKGITYTQSTVLRDTIRNQKGCDSIYTITNIIVYREPERFRETVGDCDTVVFRGITYLQDAVVIDTFKSQQGCDSFLHIYDIYVEHFEAGVTADPPEPVIGDYVTFTTSANVPQYTVNAWYPQNVFTFQFAKEQSIFIQKSDTVKVIAISAIGCIDTAVLFIKADTLVPEFVMPNAFSPNGDGLNDVFEPVFYNKSGYVVKSFFVYNRWGQTVFKAQGTKKAAWNGRYYNEDKIADPGTFFYYVDVVFIDGTKEFVKGDVTIVRQVQLIIR